MKYTSVFFVILAVVVAGCSTAPEQSSREPSQQPTLRQLAVQADMNFGTAIGVPFLESDGYTELLHRHFNHATPENAMKWESLRPEPGRFTWENADRMVEEARRSDMRIRGHALVWHSQNPGWLDNQDWEPQQLRAVMAEHIAALGERYRDDIYAWDVVNEAFQDGNSGDYRDQESIWHTTLGPDYIADAFTLAREHFPQARLYYNDYNISGAYPWTVAKSDAVYEMAQQMIEREVPIDGIGFQMHLQLDHNFDVRAFTANLQRFIELGLRVDITELDIRMAEPVTSQKLQQQARLYRRVVEAYLELSQDQADTIITWGVDDGQSWIPYTFDGFGAPLLFDDAYQPKPAFFTVQDALLSHGNR